MSPSPARGLAGLLLGLALAVGAVAVADPERIDELLNRRPEGAAGTVVIPDRFLRAWDPVTVLYVSDTGPAGGGPEDDPGRYVRVSPEHPGAWRWLDARTLQFRPAEPWPPLARVHWRTSDQDLVLSTLAAPPRRSLPADGAEGLSPVDSLTLTFAAPVDPAVLAEMITVELRELPGVGGPPQRLLTRADFTVKAMDRASASDEATYVLRFDRPIPEGQRATVRTRLSRDEGPEETVAALSFSTAPPFRVARLGCAGGMVPVTPEGTRYAREQSLGCTGEPAVVVDFTSELGALGPVEARNLLRFEPAVEGVEVSVSGSRLTLRGDFQRETLYAVRMEPTPLRDASGRALDLRGESELWLHFPRLNPYLRWGTGDGLAERLGPKRVPVEGRGHERVDLRVYSVDPLDRNLWPFTAQPISVDESRRPPGPGEELRLLEGPQNADRSRLAAQLQALGSPPVSALVDLPLTEEGGAARFGLDLAPYLEHLDGRAAPGHYLVGIRPLSGSTTRSWMRLQVTDLALTTVEEPEAVQFLVTSLSTGRPVGGARVRVEGSLQDGSERPAWTTLVSGRTDGQGVFRWAAPGRVDPQRVEVRRLVVEDGEDVLVLDAAQAPDTYRDMHWSPTRSAWLQWAFERLDGRAAPSERLAHVFTERPVYRPEEPVHVRGYVRDRFKGRLDAVQVEGAVVISGPGGLTWRTPVTLDAQGGFYHLFDEDEIPTGDYDAWFEDDQRRTLGRVSFKVEAYRLPTFEVSLHGPDTAPMDQPFEVSMTAEYYAGGRVSGQPLRWRVTQFPYTWAPEGMEGFLFSSDGRYGGHDRFEGTPALERVEVTDETGAGVITLDPTVEAGAEPRSYVVEATVTGPDDQTVTTTRTVHALPAFVVGVKLPRYLERATTIDPEVVLVGHDGQPLADWPLTVRLKRREWHSHLQASDFSDGVARYVTEVVDVPVSELSTASGAGPRRLSLPVDRAGVYLVEVEAHDRMGRAQVVTVDLYAGGEGELSWEKPSSAVFALDADADLYSPGQTANVVIRSPFRTGRALVVAETPEGNLYQQVVVRGGQATASFKVQRTWVPRLPVHVVLMRGRVDGAGDSPAGEDLGRPATLASTVWLEVSPVENTVKVALEHPERALPGQKLPVTLRLSDARGAPLSGEVTLWLVDAAVLALGREQRLDPLPDFITRVRSRLAVLDTRNRVLGSLPLARIPGGDGDEEEAGLLERVAIRKDFKAVPFYDPHVRVGADGVARVTVQLPDNLTTFKLRAKATAGPERFGVGTSQVAVRLPLVAQPALPRFVRPGDTFEAAAIGRVVEGDGGPGQAVFAAEGLRLQGEARREVAWAPGQPQRLAFPVAVEDPPAGQDRPRVKVTVAVERASDGASDAFAVSLPVFADREPEVQRLLAELGPGQPLELPAVPGGARPGTLRRSVLVSDHPGLIRAASGLDFLVEQPYGCTEQRLSRARALIAFRELRAALKAGEAEAELDAAVREALEALPEAIDERGLVAYWPGTRGYVSLTAWTVQFLVEARDAGYPVDAGVMTTLTRALERALRSDAGLFVDGESYVERTWALSALAASEALDPAYFAELSRRASWAEAEALTQIAQAGWRGGEAEAKAARALVDTLAEGVLTRLHQGQEIYAGLRPSRVSSPLILPGETRLVAQIARTFMLLAPEHPKLPLLIDALVQLAGDGGWGNTNANAEAMLALAARMKTGDLRTRPHTLRLRLGEDERSLTLDAARPAVAAIDLSGQAGRLSIDAGEGPLAARVEARWVPAEGGHLAAARSAGFVVTRRWLKQVPGSAPERVAMEQAGLDLSLRVGDVVEEVVEVVVPEDRHHVAIVVPLAAGVEVLNPRLSTAPPEARPATPTTLAPSHASFSDQAVSYFYDSLPKGTYTFAFRVRATVAGSFTQPPATAQKMYDLAVRGQSPGARVVIGRE